MALPFIWKRSTLLVRSLLVILDLLIGISFLAGFAARFASEPDGELKTDGVSNQLNSQR